MILQVGFINWLLVLVENNTNKENPANMKGWRGLWILSAWSEHWFASDGIYDLAEDIADCRAEQGKNNNHNNRDQNKNSTHTLRGPVLFPSVQITSLFSSFLIRIIRLLGKSIHLQHNDPICMTHVCPFRDGFVLNNFLGDGILPHLPRREG